MKTFIITLITVCTITVAFSQEKYDVTKEKEAIIDLIEEETQSFYDRDHDRWIDTYAQSSDNVYLSAAKNGHTFLKDWESHNNYVKYLFENEKIPNREVKTPVKIKIYDDSAWIVFNNEVFNEMGESTEMVYSTYFLEKADNKWKIIYSNRIHSGTYYMADRENLGTIQYAKSLGKSAEDVGSYYAKNAKENWLKTIDYDQYQDLIIGYFTSVTPPGGLVILEEDDQHIIFTSTGLAADLKRNGSINNVSYEEYLSVNETFAIQTGDRAGAVYKQEITDEGLKVFVSKKKEI